MCEVRRMKRLTCQRTVSHIVAAMITNLRAYRTPPETLVFHAVSTPRPPNALSGQQHTMPSVQILAQTTGARLRAVRRRSGRSVERAL